MQCKRAFPFSMQKLSRSCNNNSITTPDTENIGTLHTEKMTTHLTAKSLVNNITKLFCQDITDFIELINE